MVKYDELSFTQKCLLSKTLTYDWFEIKKKRSCHLVIRISLDNRQNDSSKVLYIQDPISWPTTEGTEDELYRYYIVGFKNYVIAKRLSSRERRRVSIVDSQSVQMAHRVDG